MYVDSISLNSRPIMTHEIHRTSWHKGPWPKLLQISGKWFGNKVALWSLCYQDFKIMDTNYVIDTGLKKDLNNIIFLRWGEIEFEIIFESSCLIHGELNVLYIVILFLNLSRYIWLVNMCGAMIIWFDPSTLRIQEQVKLELSPNFISAHGQHNQFHLLPKHF